MNSQINPNSIIPMYRQVINILNDQINSGRLKLGDKLPSETALMEQFHISRITVRAAINELVEDGLLQRSRGKGTFVAAPKSIYEANDHVGFTRSCLLAGKTPTTKLLDSGFMFPTLQDIEFLGVKESEKIVYTVRLRGVNGEPTMIERNYYLPSFAFLLEENLEGSLFELLGSKHNIHIEESIRTLEVCSATKDEASLLGIKVNTPLLLFRDKQKDAYSTPIFRSRQVYCTQKLKFYL